MKEPNNKAASAASPSRYKIDVGRYVAELERMLRANRDRSACLQALAILQRWQFDEMLEDASRQRAKMLVLRFAGNEMGGCPPTTSRRERRSR